MHLLALLAVVGVPIGMMVGAIVLQHLEQRLLGCPAHGGKSEEAQPLPSVRRAPPRPSEPRRVPDSELATVPRLR